MQRHQLGNFEPRLTFTLKRVAHSNWSDFRSFIWCQGPQFWRLAVLFPFIFSSFFLPCATSSLGSARATWPDAHTDLWTGLLSAGHANANRAELPHLALLHQQGSNKATQTTINFSWNVISFRWTLLAHCVVSCLCIAAAAATALTAGDAAAAFAYVDAQRSRQRTAQRSP